LIQLGALPSDLTFNHAVALLILGVLLAMLFATRLMLSERHESRDPNVWWVRWRAVRRQEGTFGKVLSVRPNGWRLWRSRRRVP
jgi:hypothetical protein